MLGFVSSIFAQNLEISHKGDFVNKTRTFFAVVVLSILTFASCGGSSTNGSEDDVSSESSIASDSSPPSTLGLSEFGSSVFAEAHIEFMRKIMSPGVSNMVSDIQLISAAQNVCNEVRTRSLDAWINEVVSYKSTDSVENWRIRTASTLGAVNFFCYEFKDLLDEHPIASKW